MHCLLADFDIGNGYKKVLQTTTTTTISLYTLSYIQFFESENIRLPILYFLESISPAPPKITKNKTIMYI